MKTYSLPSKAKGLIFDIDSTVYRNRDYTDHQETVLIERLAKEKALTYAETEKMVLDYRLGFAQDHNGRKPSLGNTFLYFGIPIQQSVQWREELIKPEEYLTENARLIELFEDLRRIYKLIFVTNNPSKIGRRTLEALGLNLPDIDIVGLDRSLVSKPHREPFEEAAQVLGIKDDYIVSIGDRFEVDLEVPLEMGMGAVLVENMEDLYNLPTLLPPPK